MVVPLKGATFLFQYIFWSDNSELNLEALPNNLGEGEELGMERQMHRPTKRLLLLRTEPYVGRVGREMCRELTSPITTCRVHSKGPSTMNQVTGKGWRVSVLETLLQRMAMPSLDSHPRVGVILKGCHIQSSNSNFLRSPLSRDSLGHPEGKRTWEASVWPDRQTNTVDTGRRPS